MKNINLTIIGGIVFLFICVLMPSFIQANGNITITINNRSDEMAVVMIFEGKGDNQTRIYSTYIDWGETEVFNTNLSGFHDFLVMVGQSYGFQSQDTITTRNDFVVDIKGMGLFNIRSNSYITGFETVLIFIGIAFILALKKTKREDL